jgi:hypothetical protein
MLPVTSNGLSVWTEGAETVSCHGAGAVVADALGDGLGETLAEVEGAAVGDATTAAGFAIPEGVGLADPDVGLGAAGTEIVGLAVALGDVLDDVLGESEGVPVGAALEARLEGLSAAWADVSARPPVAPIASPDMMDAASMAVGRMTHLLLPQPSAQTTAFLTFYWSRDLRLA